MGGTTRFPRDVATKVATALFNQLQPHCATILCVGSLRRGKPDVGDIEFVYVPKQGTRKIPGDLFGAEEPCPATNPVLDQLLADGTLAKRVGPAGGTAWGSSNKLAVHVSTGLPVDLFATTDAAYWSLVVCRTGPKDFNARICMAAEKIGEKWDPYAGFKDRATGELVFQPSSEAELFQHIGWDYLPPSQRV